MKIILKNNEILRDVARFVILANELRQKGKYYVKLSDYGTCSALGDGSKYLHCLGNRIICSFFVHVKLT